MSRLQMAFEKAAELLEAQSGSAVPAVSDDVEGAFCFTDGPHIATVRFRIPRTMLLDPIAPISDVVVPYLTPTALAVRDKVRSWEVARQDIEPKPETAA